jgi:hypothetical protein
MTAFDDVLLVHSKLMRMVRIQLEKFRRLLDCILRSATGTVIVANLLASQARPAIWAWGWRKLQLCRVQVLRYEQVKYAGVIHLPFVEIPLNHMMNINALHVGCVV